MSKVCGVLLPAFHQRVGLWPSIGLVLLSPVRVVLVVAVVLVVPRRLGGWVSRGGRVPVVVAWASVPWAALASSLAAAFASSLALSFAFASFAVAFGPAALPSSAQAELDALRLLLRQLLLDCLCLARLLRFSCLQHS